MNADVEALVAFYEGLSPGSIGRLRELYAADARFKDPFNDVRGVDAIERIFRHMFEQVDDPRFVVGTRIVQGRDAMLAWVFSFTTHRRAMTVRGVTHMVFDDEGRVAEHRDYWDAAEELYAKLPVIGVVLGWLARRLAA